MPTAAPNSSRATPAGTFARCRSYLGWFAVLPVLLYLLPFALLRWNGFQDWDGAGFGPAMDFAFEPNVKDADLLIFGDSSATVGLDPSAISRTLGGIKVLNLPNTIESLPITGEMALRRYLSANRPPRLLVLYFTPWSLDYNQYQGTRLYEGEQTLLAHGTLLEILRFSRKHPLDMLAVPFRFYNLTPLPPLNAIPHGAHRMGFVQATKGHFNGWYTPSLADSCRFLPENLNRASATSIQRLRSTYASSETRIMVYLAPIPGCGGADTLLNRSFADLGAAPPKQMPTASFKNDGSYSHLVLGAVPQASEDLATAIRARYPEVLASAPAQR